MSINIKSLLANKYVYKYTEYNMKKKKTKKKDSQTHTFKW